MVVYAVQHIRSFYSVSLAKIPFGFAGYTFMAFKNTGKAKNTEIARKR
jgi:hypothetical protein